MTTDLNVERILDSAPEAVPLPITATTILRMSADPQVTSKHLAVILRQDQALSARVLKIANSAFYGLPRQVASIDTAVVLLGHRTVRNLALTVSMSGVANKAVTGYGLPRGELFRHSLVVAQTASTVSKETNKSVPDEAYTAGLLHDLGKLVLDQHVEARLAAITELAATEGIAFAEAERRLLGLDHAEVGAILAEKWGLPTFLAGAIRAHHWPPRGEQSGETTSLTAVCVLANQVARNLGTGVGRHETADPNVPPQVIEILGMTNEGVAELTAEVAKQDATAAGFMEQG